MSERPDGFLARWSRRKIEVQREEARTPSPAHDQAPAPEADSESEPELTPEEIAALPKIEELTPDTDITAFLRKGVPEFLKNAALRRMWSLDPAIRDYVGDARDYAYDWNVPGGVPGNGPLLPTDDVGAMLRRMFPDDSEADVAALPDDRLNPGSQSREDARAPEDSERIDEDAEDPGGASPRDQAAVDPEMPSSPILQAGNPPAAPPLTPEATLASEPETAQFPRRRRHGGAKPL